MVNCLKGTDISISAFLRSLIATELKRLEESKSQPRVSSLDELSPRLRNQGSVTSKTTHARSIGR